MLLEDSLKSCFRAGHLQWFVIFLFFYFSLVEQFHKGADIQPDHFKMEIIGAFKRPLDRLVSEGQKISEAIDKRNKQRDRVVIMNSRTDHHQPGTVKVVAINQEY